MQAQNDLSVAPGLLVLPLDAPLCRHPRISGVKYATLASLRYRNVISPPATVLVGGIRRSWLDAMSFGWVERLPEMMSVSARVVVPGRRDRPVELVFHNIPRAGVEESVLELVRLAEPVGTLDDQLVLCFQRFVPGEATVVVTVNHGASRVRVAACFGLREEPSERSGVDEVLLRGGDWQVVATRVVHKPVAFVPAAAGTKAITVPPAARNSPVLGADQTRAVAQLGVRMATALGIGVKATFRLYQGVWHPLSCRPLLPAIGD